MAQYIDKDALVAEIKKIEEMYCYDQKTNASFVAEAVINSINNAINTLEVKEADLDKEINKYISDNFFGSETMGFFANRTKEEPDCQDIALCAKHFFELGLAQNNIENDVQKQKERLLSEIEEAVDSIDYYTVDGLLITIKEKIEELKAQKGE